jgi:hypothetical protein
VRLAIFIFFASALTCDAAQDATGRWEGSLQIPGRKRPVRHLAAVSQTLFGTTLGADGQARRTILYDGSPEFVLYRLAVRFGLPALPEWAEWFRADLLTRLKPGARIVLVMTRWHEDDLGGRLLLYHVSGNHPGQLGTGAASEGHEHTTFDPRARARTAPAACSPSGRWLPAASGGSPARTRWPSCMKRL